MHFEVHVEIHGLFFIFTNELGLTDTDLRKLLKESEQSVPSTAKATTGMESIHTVCF